MKDIENKASVYLKWKETSELTSVLGFEVLTSSKVHIVRTTSMKGNITLCRMENSFSFPPGKIESFRAHRQSSDSNITNDSFHSVSMRS